MSFSTWSPYHEYVQSGMADGAYAHGQFTMIAAGPPRLSDIGGLGALQDNQAGVLQGGASSSEIVFPLGVLQSYNLTQQKNIARIFELGSDRSYFISGRTVGQLSIGRVYYNGPSLLRVLWAYYQDLIQPTTVPPMFQNQAAGLVANPHMVVIPPGYENIFINLGSDLFNQPIGLLKYIRDSNERTLGAVYAEHCLVPGHSWTVDANGLLIQEQAQIQYERLIPVKLTNVNLVTPTNPYTGGSLGGAAQAPGSVFGFNP